MNLNRLATRLVCCAAMALAFTLNAHAITGSNVTYVSPKGSDSGSCTSSDPCQSINYALTQTASNGEIVMEASGIYAPATLDQPVSLTAPGGVDASISTMTAGANALTVNTTGDVTINGVTLRGHGVANDGILVTQVGTLRLNNLQIQYFTANGVEFKSAGSQLNVYNTNMVNNGNDGLLIDAAGAKAWVEGCSFDGNTNAGVDSGAGKVSLADSNAHNNGVAYNASAGTITLYNVRAIFNTTALQVGATGVMRMANCLLSDNATNYDIATGGKLEGSNPGTTMFATGSKTNTGTLSAPIVLK